MNRRGLGVHLTFERYGSSDSGSSKEVPVPDFQSSKARSHPEARAGVLSRGGKGLRGNWKIVLVSLLTLLQGLIIVINQFVDLFQLLIGN